MVNTRSAQFSLILALSGLGAVAAQAQIQNSTVADPGAYLRNSHGYLWDARVNREERFGPTGQQYFDYRDNIKAGNYSPGLTFPKRPEDWEAYQSVKPRPFFQGVRYDEEKQQFPPTRGTATYTGDEHLVEEYRLPVDIGPRYFYRQSYDANRDAREAEGVGSGLHRTFSGKDKVAFHQSQETFEGYPALLGPGRLADGRLVEGMPSPYWAAVQAAFVPTPSANQPENRDAGYARLLADQQRDLYNSMRAVDQQDVMAGYENYTQHMGTTVDPTWYRDTFTAQRDEVRANYPQVFSQPAQAAAAPASNSAFSQGGSSNGGGASGGLGGMGFEDAGQQSAGNFSQGF